VAGGAEVQLAAEELDVPLASVRTEQAGRGAIYGNIAMLQGKLPFHPFEEEREDGFGRVKAGRWLVTKVKRELGLSVTGGSRPSATRTTPFFSMRSLMNSRPSSKPTLWSSGAAC
jgi:hypothetical protein